VTLLQILERFILMFDGILQLLDILGSPLPESSLRLTVPLFPFL